jgi:general secretion pathway protein D
LIGGLVLAACCGLAGAAFAEKNGAEVTLNLKDADISTLIATVSEVTGKNFVIDPRVKGKVTVISSSPMDANAVYATFLSVLEVNGFAAIPNGSSVKIVPEANARTEGGGYVDRSRGLAGDDIVTKVFDIHNGSASQLVAILRPLVAQSGHLAAYTSSNSLIVSDRAANVERLQTLIDEIDVNGDRDVELVHLENASADDVVKVLTALAQQSKQTDPGAVQTTVISDPRSNSVLIGGDHSERQKLISLIKQLDSPSNNKGDTQVIYLNYASATNLAAILMGNSSSQTSKSGGSRNSMFGSSSGGSSTSAFGSNSSNSSSASSIPTSSSSSLGGAAGGMGSNPDLRVLADKDTNSLIITAPPKVMQQVKSTIEKLDIRRSQVLVEAIIAEVSADKTSQLGIDWIAYQPNAIAAAGILNSSTTAALSSLGSLASGVGTTSTTGTAIGTSLGSDSGALVSAAAGLLGSGGTALVGAQGKNGSIFGGLIKALASDADTNILSTPSLVTLDNQEAKIEVGQSVPELTGSFANTGTASNGAVNPFQTIDRQDIGLKLGITPTIGEGNTVRMDIDFEDSTIASGTAGTASLVTNKRTISNTVSIEQGQVLVIGGLIDDQVNDAVTKIPLLSSIPLIGNLFQSRTISRTKQNLMIFVHPVILRERTQGDYYTKRKYEETRRSQVEASNGPVPLIGGRAPVLYHYEDYLEKNNMPAALSTPPPAATRQNPEVAPGAAPPPKPSAALPPNPDLAPTAVPTVTVPVAPPDAGGVEAPAPGAATAPPAK